MANKCPKCQTENPDTLKFCGECGTKITPLDAAPPSFTRTLETPIEELSRGTLFADRYEIIEELGRGGMGSVYRVEDTRAKEEVALKLIKPEIAADTKTIERFRNELTTARKIAHRNVCRMFDLGEEEGTHFITMEYVSGEDLKGLIKRVKHLPSDTSISIAKQVCEGLAEAHRLGVVHRDLKPSNIMIDKEGNARIMDFGIARTIKGKEITGEGVMIGTPEYMSPEQVEAKEVDRRSDIYSLGIILYEMVTGHLPFEGDTPLAVAMKHKGETPKNPKDINPHIPDALSAVILKCLEKNRDDRFQGVEEFQAELEIIKQGLPTTERVIPKKRPLTSKEITVQLNMKKMFIPVLAVFALIVVALVLGWPWGKKAGPVPSDKPSLAILYFTNNTGDEGLSSWRSALPELLIDDLSQSKYMYILPKSRLLSILTKFSLDDKDNYTHEDLRNVASWCGINHIITGSYFKSGDDFRVNITLQDADSGEVIGSENSEGIGEGSLFGIVDELTEKIKTHMQLPGDKIADDLDQAVGNIKTNSPEAYKYFSQGEKLYLMTQYEAAIPFLEKAVAIDPELAMAYRHLSAIADNTGRDSEMGPNMEKAIALVDKISERERLLIQGQYSMFLKDYTNALETLNKLVQIYPDDFLGHRLIGLIYSMHGEWEKAVEYAELAFQNNPESGIECCNLVYYSGFLGFVDKPGIILEKFLNDFPESIIVKRQFVENLMVRKQYSAALEELEELFRLAPTTYNYPQFRGDIYLLMGDVSRAEQEYTKLLKTENRILGLLRLSLLYRSLGKFNQSKEMLEKMLEEAEKQDATYQIYRAHREIAYLYLDTGKLDEALEEAIKAKEYAFELNQNRTIQSILSLEANIHLALKSIPGAEKTVIELQTYLKQQINKRDYKRFHLAKGLIKLEKGNFKKAIEDIKQAVSLTYYIYNAFNVSSYISYIEPLALAYYEANDLEAAQEEYEKIISYPTARRDSGDIYAESFYMLGKIHEQQGNTAQAIENYEKFLDLWKDADPGIAEVEDARTKLAELTQ